MRLSASSLSTVQVYQSLVSGGRRDQHPNLGRLSVSTMTAAMKIVSELGFTSYELYVDSESNLSLLLDDENIRLVQWTCADLGLKVERVYFEFLPHHLLDGSSLSSIAATWSAIGRLCGRLGTQIVEMVSPPLPRSPQKAGSQDFESLWADFVSSMKGYTAHATSYGLKLAIEPRPREILSGTDSLLRLLDHISSDTLGGVVDISHLQIVREMPDVSIRKLDKKVFSVHLSDNDGVTEWHWAPGQGQIDWPSVMDSLASIRYDDTLSLDVSGIDVRRELMEGKKFVGSMLEKVVGSSSVRKSMAV